MIHHNTHLTCLFCPPFFVFFVGLSNAFFWYAPFFAAFVLYAVLVLMAVFIIVFLYIPLYGQTHIMCYIGVCSLVGSLSVCIINSIHFFTIFHGTSKYQIQFKVSSFTGDERESCWHCFKAYLFRNESASIPPNVGFYLHCSTMRHYSDELSEQGNDPPVFTIYFF